MARSSPSLSSRCCCKRLIVAFGECPYCAPPACLVILRKKRPLLHSPRPRLPVPNSSSQPRSSNQILTVEMCQCVVLSVSLPSLAVRLCCHSARATMRLCRHSLYGTENHHFRSFPLLTTTYNCCAGQYILNTSCRSCGNMHRGSRCNEKAWLGMKVTYPPDRSDTEGTRTPPGVGTHLLEFELMKTRGIACKFIEKSLPVCLNPLLLWSVFACQLTLLVPSDSDRRDSAWQWRTSR